MNIKILVCYHKPSFIMANEVLRPILVGSKQAKYSTIAKLEQMCSRQNSTLLKDNVGDDNISELNPYFCELTAMYWAWKNLDADYYGLFHYRRVFDFSGRARKKIHIKNQTMSNVIKYFHLEPKKIQKIISNFDIIKPLGIDINLYEDYANFHYKENLDLCIEYILKKYPEMQNSINVIFLDKTYKASFCNMFIMRKDLYFEYCTWLFDILFEVKQYIPYETYDDYQKRVFGFLAERLFNVWIEYKRENIKLKIKNIQLANLLENVQKKPIFGWKIDNDIKKFYLFGI
ncbi:DUF4422 domain-containing protein, partial [Campylobacter coli]|nr:DUF4422 domain-containing protein [Campylobacter coli]